MRTTGPDQTQKHEIDTAEPIAAPKPGVGNAWGKVFLPLPPHEIRDPYPTTINELEAALAELTGPPDIEIGRDLADGRLLQGTIQWIGLNQQLMGIGVAGIKEIFSPGRPLESGSAVIEYSLDLSQGFRLEWRTKSKLALMIVLRDQRWVRIGDHNFFREACRENREGL